jgi:hypothetical protein
MKKLLLSLFFICLIASSFAQDQERYNRDLIVKWAPGSLASGKLTLAGEYNFKKKHSVELIIGIPKARNYHLDYDGNSSDLSIKGFSALLGYRYYLGKKDVAGFYVEPYAKYLHHQAHGVLIGTLNGETAMFDTHTDYKGIGVGAQLGVQFLIAKKISLDFFLLGPEANSSQFSTTATDVASSIPWTHVEASEAEQDIKDVVQDIPLVGDKIQVIVDQATKTVTTRYSGFMPGFRFGASIGVRL